MPAVNMMGVWTCPACDYEQPFDDGKDAERIIDHLEAHVRDE